MTACIDLRKRFGEVYCIQSEVGTPMDRRRPRRDLNPWLLTIPCGLGHIYPHGGEFLGASTDRRGRAANRLASLPGVRVVQDGDDGVNVVFHVRNFHEIAKILKPRRRRRLSAEEKAERVERLRSFQFSPASQSSENDRRRDGAEQADSEDQCSAA